jgi:DNA-binding HxlR family transcriptional regulator
MKRSSFAAWNCSVAQSLEVIGEWWTLLILRDAFLGVTRFESFHERLGIARNILAARLETLTDAGVFERRCYDEARSRYDYVLTDKGRALWPVLASILRWGDEWITGAGNEPLALVHRGCGETTHGVLVCEHCGERLDARAVKAIPGPGSRDENLVDR